MLLTPEERHVCEQLAAGKPPYSQRAQSLLAVDEGATQTSAAQQTGQTVGQVRYWLGKFRISRMDIFPKELLPQSEPELLPSQLLTDQPTRPEASDHDQPTKQDASGKKSNRSKEEGKLIKKGKAKSKKKSKKVKTPRKLAKKVKKKKKSNSGEKRKEKKSKKGKNKQDKTGKKKQNKKKQSGEKTGKNKKKG